MADKRRYTISLPDHVADAVENHARPLGSTPTEYAADVVRWWFGQGCPAVTPDEAQLRKSKLSDSILKGIEPLPKNLDAWSLDSKKDYIITDDSVVQKLLGQLGVPNLFARTAEHDKIRFFVAFDNHPTHWLVLDIFKGTDRPDGDGLSFQALPKIAVSREEMLQKLQAAAKEMASPGPVKFSQIPKMRAEEKPHPATTKVQS